MPKVANQRKMNSVCKTANRGTPDTELYDTARLFAITSLS